MSNAEFLILAACILFISFVWIPAFVYVLWGSLHIYSGEWEPSIPHPKIAWTVLVMAFSAITFAVVALGVSAENHVDHYNPATASTTSTQQREAK